MKILHAMINTTPATVGMRMSRRLMPKLTIEAWIGSRPNSPQIQNKRLNTVASTRPAERASRQTPSEARSVMTDTKVPESYADHDGGEFFRCERQGSGHVASPNICKNL
jgi:hypothetical protein